MPITNTPDWTDPCQRYAVLRQVWMSMLTGQQTSQVRYVANGVEREVRYYQHEHERAPQGDGGGAGRV